MCLPYQVERQMPLKRVGDRNRAERQRSVRDLEIAPTASRSLADQSRRKVTLTDVRTGTGLP